MADPLHKFGNEGAWVHVDSGWQFPQHVSDFSRVAQPYNIDGNNDAGAEYRHGAATIELEIYAADSAATDATMDGAKATALRKAGHGARLLSEESFEVGTLGNARMEGGKVIKGAKITYATDGKTQEARTRLYYFATDDWRVLVRASTENDGKAGDRLLDEFVRALPWATLGSDSGLH